jgi:ATP-binding protein involved in chromosome partitioning
LDLFEQPKMTPEKKLIPLEKYGMQVMSFGFISGNKTPVIWRGPLVSRMTEQFFMDVEWGSLDFLILDLPPGTGDIQLTLTQKIKMTGAIIITTPQDIALSDVRKGADMFKKVNTPVLGVVENMSGLFLSGNTNNPNSKININNEELEIDVNGNFNINIDIFKKGGGQKESERLGVPLLGKIPLSKEIMNATDSGIPIVVSDSNQKTGEVYFSLADKVSKIIKL